MGTEYHAYQIALKTLKERCDYLQNKLESVEEENCQLKLQMSQDVKVSPRSILDVDQLRLQITRLTEQKVKLNNQVQLVTSENQKLWTRLSKIACGSENIEGRAPMRDDPHKYLEGNPSYSENHSDLEISKVAIAPENSRESFEEVSLKLSALVLDKGALQPEIPHNIDLYVYKNPLQMENFAFSSSDNAPIINNFKNHIMKLKQFKQTLQNNKNDLTSAISLFKNFQKSNLCSECGKTFPVNCDGNSNRVNKVCDTEEQVNDLPTLQVHEIGVDAAGEISGIAEKICPLCGATFSGSLPEFHQHVSDHFSDEEPDVTTTFEVLP